MFSNNNMYGDNNYFYNKRKKTNNDINRTMENRTFKCAVIRHYNRFIVYK